MASRALARTATWLIRLLQLFFSIILMGIVSYMIHQYREYGGGDDSVPDELIVSEVASVLGVFVSLFSILAIFFLGYTLQLLAAFLDFVIFVLYLASCGLLKDNFHSDSDRNPLRNALINMRAVNGESVRVNRHGGLVKMLVAGVVIQVVLFFVTTVLGAYVASRTKDRRERGTRRVGRRRAMV
ncbi:hypothetical protein EX30DRAFT_374443 [Ascodesmis nigricans]|uniref:MARVEL domain-containing protein n=1 Tax=Ascodesmis nigricans TaxID=341454 RepID=A0A4S2ML50_9PEZI|nr:hypothetical protein EX30DRAFT_374443 [Ascodesmis nigricans]